MSLDHYRDETNCLHGGYTPGNGEPRVVPIVQSTTFVFDSAEEISAVFDDPSRALIYSRFANPTVMAVEAKIAALENGAAAMCTSSGQAASLLSILNLCKAGDSFVSASQIYGGTFNLFSHTLKRLGIECIFVDANADAEDISRAIKPNTRLVFGEVLANPALTVLDIEKFAAVAHSHGLPLIVDNTFPTPILCKPIDFGADIVVHSTTKYMDGHAATVGGVIVDSGRFDWQNGKFPELCEPDESYHGVRYTVDYPAVPYLMKARMQLMRDFGCYPAAQTAFILNLGLDTLALRMPRYCENAMRVARFLQGHERVASLVYPALPGDANHGLYQKYLKGAAGVISFTLKGGKDTAMSFLNRLRLISNEVHVADIRSCILHPASTTHRQLSDAGLKAAGVDPAMLRLSVGLEHVEDVLEDLTQGLSID